MKKNKMMRIASVLLVAVLLSTCAISGTFAKYTSTASGSSTATVAKWSITWNGGTDPADDQEIAVSGTAPELKFDLFSTINDTGNTADETDVADGKIAPGVAGEFGFSVSNSSEVTAKCTISFSEENANNIPIQYSLDDYNWVDSIEALNADANLTQIFEVTDGRYQTVYWRWVFEGTTSGAHTGQTDTSDTALGIMGTAPTVTITATITAEQVD